MKYSDNDVLWLALNNEGYQFDRFVDRLYKSKNYGANHYLILNFFKDYKLETGIDLFVHLQNPNVSNWVNKKQYVAITGKEPVSEKMFTYDWDEEKEDWILMPSKTITDNKRFPIYPSFNWGNVRGKAAIKDKTNVYRGNIMKIGDSYLEDGVKKIYGEKQIEPKIYPDLPLTKEIYPDMKYIEYYSDWEDII